MKIAGVVVLYNPDIKVINNIKLYINDLDVLYAIDNSDKRNMELIKEFKENKKIRYKDNHGNKGIAQALNRGADLAISQGYKWLLTMDQDSRAEKNMLFEMKRYIIENDTTKVGIVTPKIINEGDKIIKCKNKYSYKMTAITSGSLINLTAYIKVGRFLNKLFIDTVDTEYCFRLNQYYYKIIQINDAVLNQTYGKPIKFNNLELYYYSPKRLYYQTRNGLYVYYKYKKKYPVYCRKVKEDIMNRLYHNIIYNNNKLIRIMYILRGVMDYSCRRYGSL